MNGMNEMQIFAYDDAMVRTVEIGRAHWFVGRDVATALGYENHRDALAKHVDDEDKNTVAIRDGIRGNPNVTVINESGLYSLIFGSRLEGARRFKRWVTSEVLPALNRSGAYSMRPAPALSADETRATLAALSKSLAEVRRLYESGAASAEAAGGMAMGVFELMGASVHEMAIPLGGGWTDGELSASVHLFFRERVTFAGRNDAVGTRELYEAWTEWTGMAEVPRRAFTCKVRSLYPALTYKQKRNGQDAMPQYHFFGIRLRDEITAGNVIAMPAIKEADK